MTVEWLKPYARLSGMLPSAPLDLPQRLNAVTHALQQAGWRVVVESIGTDFAGPGGVPIPRSQPLILRLHRTDRPYTPDDAEAALRTALRNVSLDYSPLGRWAGELASQVVQPTIDQALTGSATALKLIGFAGIGYALLALFGKKR